MTGRPEPTPNRFFRIRVRDTKERVYYVRADDEKWARSRAMGGHQEHGEILYGNVYHASRESLDVIEVEAEDVPGQSRRHADRRARWRQKRKLFRQEAS